MKGGFSMGYWDATYQYLQSHGGPPTCPHCRKKMFPEDDHGRFTCFCDIGTFDAVSGVVLPVPPPIPQVDTTGMSDEEKAKIPPINRLDSLPTKVEAKLLSITMKGPDCMDDPEYWKSCEALEKERGLKKQ